MSCCATSSPSACGSSRAGPRGDEAVRRILRSACARPARRTSDSSIGTPSRSFSVALRIRSGSTSERPSRPDGLRQPLDRAAARRRSRRPRYRPPARPPLPTSPARALLRAALAVEHVGARPRARRRASWRAPLVLDLLDVDRALRVCASSAHHRVGEPAPARARVPRSRALAAADGERLGRRDAAACGSNGTTAPFRGSPCTVHAARGGGHRASGFGGQRALRGLSRTGGSARDLHGSIS